MRRLQRILISDRNIKHDETSLMKTFINGFQSISIGLSNPLLDYRGQSLVSTLFDNAKRKSMYNSVVVCIILQFKASC